MATKPAMADSNYGLLQKKEKKRNTAYGKRNTTSSYEALMIFRLHL